MKNLLKIAMAFIFVAIASFTVISQDCEAYFPMEKGAVRVMENYNAKDKFQGKVTYEVRDITNEGDVTSIHVNMLVEDKKGEETTSTDLIMECEDGVFKVDMKSLMPDGMMPGGGDMEVEVDANNLEYPSGLSVGMELPDGSINMSMKSSGIAMMNMKVDVYNRKVEAMETITTPAGSFECYKISQDSEMKSMMKVKAKSTEWIARDIGTVRSESYDKNGKLQGYSILTGIE